MPHPRKILPFHQPQNHQSPLLKPLINSKPLSVEAAFDITKEWLDSVLEGAGSEAAVFTDLTEKVAENLLEELAPNDGNSDDEEEDFGEEESQ